jgi:hypothetical protein
VGVAAPVELLEYMVNGSLCSVRVTRRETGREKRGQEWERLEEARPVCLCRVGTVGSSSCCRRCDPEMPILTLGWSFFSRDINQVQIN